MRIGKTAALLAGMVAICLSAGGHRVGAETMTVDGIIEPSMVVELGSSVTGVLQRVAVDRGDTIRAGQVLATLESGVEKATLELARARAQLDADIRAKRERLAFAARKQARFETLFQKKAVSFEQMDEVKTDRALSELDLQQAIEERRIAELEMNRAAELLSQRTIRSPVDGVVVERFMSPGEYVEDRPVLKIARIDPLYVEVILSVDSLGLVRKGMDAEVRPREPVGGTYAAVVTVVDRVVDAASSTFGVRLEMANPENRISAGVNCTVTFLESKE